MATTYLTTDELSARIKYDTRTIRERMLDSVLIEGVHYIRPFGGRKILYIWEKIEADMALASTNAIFAGSVVQADVDNNDQNGFAIPMANGGACRVGKLSAQGGHVKVMGVHHGKH